MQLGFMVRGLQSRAQMDGEGEKAKKVAGKRKAQQVPKGDGNAPKKKKVAAKAKGGKGNPVKKKAAGKKAPAKAGTSKR